MLTDSTVKRVKNFMAMTRWIILVIIEKATKYHNTENQYVQCHIWSIYNRKTKDTYFSKNLQKFSLNTDEEVERSETIKYLGVTWTNSGELKVKLKKKN